MDIVVFLAFFVVVVGVSMFKSRREKSSEDYFLASRGLTWPLIGLSIVAANISTEQFVGMAGQGAGDVGLAVSNWQLVGTVGIVVIAFTLLPRFLKAGIYTMPEFLEYRYNSATRAIMAVITVVIYVTVLLTAVLYSGGLTLSAIFDMPLARGVWVIGIIAMIYTAWGGLKAVAWADLFQGSALLVGGIVTFFLGLKVCGGWGAFSEANADKLHMILPSDHGSLPWTGVFAGMWIVIVYYCGLNQFIVQRNLAAKTLRDGQLGVIFAGALWLLVPFAIVMPGIMAVSQFKPELAAEADKTNTVVMERAAEADALPGAVATVLVPDEEWKARRPEEVAAIEALNEQRRQAAAREGRETEQEVLIGYKYDAAFPVLIRRLVPSGLRGFMFAAIAGAVISSLASMLNSASTIFTMDVYHRLFARTASQGRLVWLGRVMTLVFVAIGCSMAPMLDNPGFGGVFQYIQQFQGYIWPGVVAVFVFGVLVETAPGAAGVAGLLAGPAIYGLLQFFAPNVHFLIQVGIAFQLVLLIMGLITFWWPLKEPRKLPVRKEMDLKTKPIVKWAGAAVVAGVALFYAFFW